MIAAMREVVPDIRVDVDYVASTVWSKSAEKVLDADGRLMAWSPPSKVGRTAPPRRRGLKAGTVGK